MKRCTRDDVYAFITKAGLQGRTFGEIQRFVVEKNGMNYDEKKPEVVWNNATGPTHKIKMVRRHRGYWCTNLCGAFNCGNNRVGILELATVKRGKQYVSKAFADLV